jgi:ABC-type Mn2+/Zn2+ transport system permease subunit
MFEPVFMQLALAASVATGISLGVMGVYLVMRRVVFLGLVVANAATLGAAVAEIVGWPAQLLSLAAAIAAAVALGEVHSSNRMSAESLMGWAYAAASSATVLLLSRVSGSSADTSHLLFGNVLAVEKTSVAVVTAIALIVVSMQLLFGRRLLLVTFDPEAAMVAGVNTRLWSLILNLAIGVAAAAAVQAIGALSTFALLTLPAMAALLATGSVCGTFAAAAALSVTLPSLALAVSFYLDVPAGPASVALLAASVPIAAMTKGVARGAGRSRVSRPMSHAVAKRLVR